MIKRAFAAAAAIAAVGMLAGCGGLRAYAAHDPLPDPSATPTVKPAGKPAATAKPAPASRCVSVGKAEQKALTGLLKPGVTGTKFAAVRSADFDQVYMVAVRLAGKGIGTNYNAVFATDSLNGTGQTFAVDGFAQEYTSLGEPTQQGVTPDADGVAEAQACVARAATAGGANLPG